MQWVFLNPAALAFLAIAIVPLIVHVVVKRPARRVAFPTLRFISPASSRAARLRQLGDWRLWLVRTLLLALAAVAVARPLIVTPARARSWEERVARLVVVDRSESVLPRIAAARALAAREVEGAALGRVVEVTDVLRAVRQAAEVFATFPPARRELVIVSDFQEGVAERAAFAVLPPGVGTRFVRVPTVATAQRLAPVSLPEVIAPDTERIAVRRALDAVASANGLPAETRDPRVVIGNAAVPEVIAMRQRGGPVSAPWMADVVHDIERTWRSMAAAPRVESFAVDGRLLIVTDAGPRSFAFPLLVNAVVRGLTSEHSAREALLPRLSDRELAALERPASGVPPESVRHSPEADARWFWTAVALLLAAEGWMRSRRGQKRAAEAVEEHAA